MSTRHPLGALIEAIQRARGWSDRELEIKSSGVPGLGKSNLSKMKNHPLNSIKGQNIKNLATLLSLPEETIALAALASMEVPIEAIGQMSALAGIQSDQRLSPEDKGLLVSLVDRMYQVHLASEPDHARSGSPRPEARPSSMRETESERYEEAAGEGGRVETKQRRKGGEAERHPDDDILDGFA